MFVVLGSKVPLPPLHTPPVATVNEPARVTAALFAQTVRSAPAFAVGVGVMMKVTASLTALQFPFPVVVKVSVTVPAVRSAALGVYTALIVVLFGLYVPAPLLQETPVDPVNEPFKRIALLFAQTDPFKPASTVGDGVKVITRLSATAMQLPFPVVVKVSVNVPAASSVGVGV